MARNDQLPTRQRTPDQQAGALRQPRVQAIESGRYFTSVARAGRPGSTPRLSPVNQDSGLGQALMSMGTSIGNLGRLGSAVYEQTIAKKHERDQERMALFIEEMEAAGSFPENMDKLKSMFDTLVKEGTISPLENPVNWERLQRTVADRESGAIISTALADPAFQNSLKTLSLDESNPDLVSNMLRQQIQMVLGDEADERFLNRVLSSDEFRKADIRANVIVRNSQAELMLRELERSSAHALSTGDAEGFIASAEGIPELDTRLPTIIREAANARIQDEDFDGALEVLSRARELAVDGLAFSPETFPTDYLQIEQAIRTARDRHVNELHRVHAATKQETARVISRVLLEQGMFSVSSASEMLEIEKTVINDLMLGAYDDTLREIASATGAELEDVRIEAYDAITQRSASMAAHQRQRAAFTASEEQEYRQQQQRSLELTTASVAVILQQRNSQAALELVDAELERTDISDETRAALLDMRASLVNPSAVSLASHPAFVQARAELQARAENMEALRWFGRLTPEQQREVVRREPGLTELFPESMSLTSAQLSALGIPEWDEIVSRIRGEVDGRFWDYLNDVEPDSAPIDNPLALAQWKEQNAQSFRETGLEDFRGLWNEVKQQQKELEEAEEPLPEVINRFKDSVAFDIGAGKVTGSPLRLLAGTEYQKESRAFSRAIAQANARGELVNIPGWRDLPGPALIRRALDSSPDTWAEVVESRSINQALEDLATIIRNEASVVRVSRPGRRGTNQVDIEMNLSEAEALYREARSVGLVITAEELYRGVDRNGIDLGDVSASSQLLFSPRNIQRIISGEPIVEGVSLDIRNKASMLGVTRDELVEYQTQLYKRMENK